MDHKSIPVILIQYNLSPKYGFLGLFLLSQEVLRGLKRSWESQEISKGLRRSEQDTGALNSSQEVSKGVRRPQENKRSENVSGGLRSF